MAPTEFDNGLHLFFQMCMAAVTEQYLGTGLASWPC